MAQTPKHSIKAYLYDNPLTDDPNDFTARVKSEKSLSIEAVSASAVDRGGANISKDEMSRAVRLWLKEANWLVNDSYSINAEFFSVVASIRGSFSSSKEKFNRSKHSLLYQFSQGEIMRQGAKDAEVEILGVADVGTEIAQVTDVKSSSVNDLITPGFVTKIRGSKIKITGDNPAVGVYFRNSMTSEMVKIDESDIITNMPAELIIMNPVLPPGEYTLIVTTQYAGGSTTLKEPRTSEYDKVLRIT